MSLFLRLSLAACTLLFASCSVMKAGPVKPSTFLSHADQMQRDPKSPFLRSWRNDSKQADAIRAKSKDLVVKPVTLAQLRPMSRRVAEACCSETSRQAGAAKLAQRLADGITRTLSQQEEPRYVLVTKRGRTTLELEIAVIEFNPNPFAGGVVRTAITQVALPGLDSFLAKPFKGNIAIEGRLKDPRTGTVLYEFADNEENKSPLIVSINDFRRFGQAEVAVDEWSRQIAAVLQAEPGERVRDASSFVILPWH